MIDQGRQSDCATMRLPTEGNRAESVAGVPFWLDLEPEPIYGVLHTPREGIQSRVAALILPTFGWDNDFSYRPRRDWAAKLAEAGVSTARIDFPGSEDSVGSPLSPNRVQSWVDATSQTAHWLRERTGCDRLVVIGIGLGGLIAHQAIAANAPIDDLALWGVRATGRAYVRELRAFAAIVSGQIGGEQDDARADGAISIGGHLMSAETAETLSAIKIAELPLPQAALRRVLLLGRDAQGVDAKLALHLKESGAAVTELNADDYFALMADPVFGWTPTKTILASIDWVLDSSSVNIDPINHLTPLAVPETLDSVEFTYGGVSIRERLSELETPSGRLVGIISEPTGIEQAPHCLVVVNAGALRHTGPSRMFAEVARRAAASGVPTARFDLPGLGDSDGSVERPFERRPEDDAKPLAALKAIYDHLEQLGIADRFVGTGLCLGGYFSIRTILDDERAIAAISANPPAFRWTEAHSRRGTKWFAAVSGATPIANDPSDSRPARLLRRTSHRAVRVLRSIEFRLGQRAVHLDLLWRFEHRAGIAAASKTLDQLGTNGAKVVLLLSEDETVLRILAQSKLAAKLAQWPNIEVDRLSTRDHNLRPLQAQEIVLDRVSSVLRELGSEVEARATPRPIL